MNFPKAKMTLPTKVPSDNLGRIGSLKRTSDKSLFPMVLGSCGHRITHQLRPIKMNGRSILSVTSRSLDQDGTLADFSADMPAPGMRLRGLGQRRRPPVVRGRRLGLGGIVVFTVAERQVEHPLVLSQV